MFIPPTTDLHARAMDDAQVQDSQEHGPAHAGADTEVGAPSRPAAGGMDPQSASPSQEAGALHGAAPCPSPAAVPLTDWQIEVGAQRKDMMLRLEALQAAYAARGEVLSLRRAASLLGTSIATLSRMRRRWNGEFASAVPERRKGRPARWEDIAEIPEVRARLHELYLLSCGASSDYMTKGRRTGSAAATLKIFSRDPLCARWPELGQELAAGRQPLALVRVIRQMNDLHEQRLRGTKHSSLHASLISRRSLIELLQDGSTQQIALGDWWVFDDMSDNLPHWWTGPGNEPLLGRQGLYCYDLVRRWMAVEKVGTVRDSYTAAIILRFIRRLMEAFGKPRRGVVFERSVWQARTITGVRISRDGQLVEEAVERPALADDDKAALQDGLRGLGILVHYTFTPRGKEIEGAFNHLQRLKPMVASQWAARRRAAGTEVRQPVNIGRHAGEFESAAKQLRRVRAGSHHPADLGFLHIEDSLEIDLETFEVINGEAVQYPQLAPLTEADRAVFLPEKRQLQIRDGRVTATVDGQPLDFSAPELFAALGTGYRLVVAFDPSEPTLGAALYNAETSTSNHQGWRVGEYIGHAEFLPTIARFDWRERDERGADAPPEARRRYAGAIRTAFGAVGLGRVRSSEARDGRGAVARVDGAAPARREPAAVEPPFRRNPLAAPSQDDFARLQARIAADAALVRSDD